MAITHYPDIYNVQVRTVTNVRLSEPKIQVVKTCHVVQKATDVNYITTYQYRGGALRKLIPKRVMDDAHRKRVNVYHPHIQSLTVSCFCWDTEVDEAVLKLKEAYMRELDDVYAEYNAVRQAFHTFIGLK